MALALRHEHAELAGQLGLPPDRLPWVCELEQFVADPAIPARLRAEANELFVSLGNLHFQRDELDLASACFSRSMSAWARVPLATGRDRFMSSSAQQLAWSRLGAVETERGRHAAAEECYLKAVVAALELAGLAEDDAFCCNTLLESFHELAESVVARGSLDAARELVAAAAPLLDRAESPAPDEAMDFVTSLVGQASLACDLEDWPSCLHYLEKAIACLGAQDESNDRELTETRATAYLSIALHQSWPEGQSTAYARTLEAMDVLERARSRLAVDDEELHAFEAELLWAIGFLGAEYGPAPQARLALLRALAIVTRLPASQRENLVFTAKDIRATLSDLEEEG